MEYIATERPFAVAIVGAGPSGFYAAEALLRASDDIAVYIFEKLPVPYGLVRYGVAPDHPKLKAVTAVFDRIAAMEGFCFCGNTAVGRDVSIETLQEHFHAIIFAHGPEAGMSLGIPGEDLPGSFTAHEFVAWYNGHPDYRDLQVDLKTETAAVVGNGNVALDVARILAKPVDVLRQTDIADHALEVLAESLIRDVHVIGRRGPAQVQFVSKELREFGETEGFSSTVSPNDIALQPACLTELEAPNATDLRLSHDLLTSFSQSRPDQPRTCHFRFFQTPERIEGDTRVESLRLRRNALSGDAFAQRAISTDVTEELACGLFVTSVGFKPSALDPLALVKSQRHAAHEDGRVLLEGDQVATGLYVTGWAKRGPQGTIGTNRGDSVETVESLLADKEDLASAPKRDVARLLDQMQNHHVTFGGWQSIDRQEKQMGRKMGRPRVKLTSTSKLLQASRAM